MTIARQTGIAISSNPMYRINRVNEMAKGEKQKIFLTRSGNITAGQKIKKNSGKINQFSEIS